jgi:hypothetical protein
VLWYIPHFIESRILRTLDKTFEAGHVPFLRTDDFDDSVSRVIPWETCPKPSYRESIEVNGKCSLHNSLSITMQSWIQSDNAKI